jgi:Ca2+-binding EF-hand superfamily protein
MLNMNLSARLVVALLAGAISLAGILPPAYAHPPPYTEAQRRERQEIAFKEMDQNRDGQVSLAEFLAYYHRGVAQGRRRFIEHECRLYDRNGDGVITLEEFLAAVTVRDRFLALDLNRDGRISREEFIGPEPLFRAMDCDGDGLVTWEEYWRVVSRIQK